MPRYRIDIDGHRHVQKNLGIPGADKLKRRIEDDIENSARQSATRSAGYAPIDTGYLKTTIYKSPQKEGRLHWAWGSIAPYAQRQEYEHKPKRRFLYRAAFAQPPMTIAQINETIRDTF